MASGARPEQPASRRVPLASGRRQLDDFSEPPELGRANRPAAFERLDPLPPSRPAALLARRPAVPSLPLYARHRDGVAQRLTVDADAGRAPAELESEGTGRTNAGAGGGSVVIVVPGRERHVDRLERERARAAQGRGRHGRVDEAGGGSEGGHGGVGEREGGGGLDDDGGTGGANRSAARQSRGRDLRREMMICRVFSYSARAAPTSARPSCCSSSGSNATTSAPGQERGRAGIALRRGRPLLCLCSSSQIDAALARLELLSRRRPARTSMLRDAARVPATTTHHPSPQAASRRPLPKPPAGGPSPWSTRSVPFTAFCASARLPAGPSSRTASPTSCAVLTLALCDHQHLDPGSSSLCEPLCPSEPRAGFLVGPC